MVYCFLNFNKILQKNGIAKTLTPCLAKLAATKIQNLPEEANTDGWSVKEKSPQILQAILNKLVS